MTDLRFALASFTQFQCECIFCTCCLFVQSWNDFGDVLRKENRILFRQMTEDIRSYSESAKTKEKNFSFESMCV